MWEWVELVDRQPQSSYLAEADCALGGYMSGAGLGWVGRWSWILETTSTFDFEYRQPWELKQHQTSTCMRNVTVDDRQHRQSTRQSSPASPVWRVQGWKQRQPRDCFERKKETSTDEFFARIVNRNLPEVTLGEECYRWWSPVHSLSIAKPLWNRQSRPKTWGCLDLPGEQKVDVWNFFFCRLTIWVVYRHVMLLFWKCMARVHG